PEGADRLDEPERPGGLAGERRTMAVTVQCPNPDCHASFSIADEDLSRTEYCPKCGSRLVAPPTVDLNAQESYAHGSSFDTGGPPAQPSELADGATFGRYKIVRKVGQGGMGAVYLAHDTHLGRDVALKVPHFAPADGSDMLQRFYREARAAAGFDHPN